MRIENISKLCTATSLVLKIRELEQLEKYYQSIQIKVESNEWIDIPIAGIESHESGTIIVDNLPTNTVQRVMGRVMFNDIYEVVPDTSFIIQEPVIVPIIPYGGATPEVVI